MKKTIIATLPLALSAAALVTTPASAAPGYKSNAHQLRADIRQLDRQIDITRGLSNREERRLERRVNNLQRLQRRYARGGFARWEMRHLRQQVTSIKIAIRQMARNGNHGNRAKLRNGRTNRVRR